MPYLIKSGDTLGGIAQANNTTVANLQTLNPQITDPNKIYAGQNLNLSATPVVTTTGPITADGLNTSQTPAKLPGTPVDNGNYAGILAGMQALQNNVAQFQKDEEAKAASSATSNQMPDYLKTYLEGSTPPPSTADAYTQAQNQAGIQQKQQLVNDLTAQLNTITAGVQADALKLPSEGISQGGINSRNTSNEREAAIRALPISAQLQAAQGNLNAAKADLNTLFELKSTDATNLYNYNKSLRDSVFEIATEEQKRRLQLQDRDDEREYQMQINNLNQAQTWASTAISNGQGDLAGQIMALDPKSADYQTKLSALAAQIEEPVAPIEVTAGASLIDPVTGRIISTAPKSGTGGGGTTYKSGGMVITTGEISAGQSLLDSSRGITYRDANNVLHTPPKGDTYANSQVYLDMLAAWKADSGLEQDFFTKYPPKNYLNPNDKSIPQYIRDKLKASSEDREP